MATIANLGVSLTAKTGNFEKGFKKAKRTVENFSRDVAGHVGTIARYGAAVTGIALGALVHLIKQQGDAVDATSKLSRTLGLSTEQLVGYQHAADLAGVDLDKLAAGILRVNGSAEGSMAGMTTDERLLVIADQYKAIGNASERAAFLVKNFGKAGLQMGSLFEQGAEGIKAAQQQAKDMGLTFTDVQGRMVEEANDSMTKVGKAVGAIGMRFAIDLSPYIIAASNRMLEFAQNSNTSGGVVVNALDQIFAAAGKIANAFEFIKGMWFSFVSGVTASAGVVTKTMSYIGNVMEHGLATANAFLIAGIETNALDAVASSFFEKAEEAAKSAGEAWSDFATGQAGKKVESYFNRLKVEAAEIADTIGGAAAPTTGGPATNKTSEFRQVDLERVFIGGPQSAAATITRGEQQIVAQQKSTNAYLSIISRRGIVV